MCTVMVSPIEYSIHHITDCIQSGDFIEFATLVGIILHNYFTVYSRVLVCDSRIILLLLLLLVLNSHLIRFLVIN
jgi:hypothetical protein